MSTCRIFTACDNNSYGVGCKELCGNCSNRKPCHHVDGSCQFGCDVGVFGLKCNTGIALIMVSRLKKYTGISYCCQIHCQKYLGQHISWIYEISKSWMAIEIKCVYLSNLVCPTGRYGTNCAKTCGPNCQNCNRFNGVCEFGCLPEWTGTYCEKRRKNI